MRSGRAEVRRELPLAAHEAWDLLTDVRNHARWVPLTRVDAPQRLTLGDAFTAWTGPFARAGLPGFADRMVVDRFDPPTTASPGRATFRKLGPVLLGAAEVIVVPEGEACVVRWVEDVHVRGLPRRLTDPVLRRALGAMLRLVLRRVHAELDAR